MLFNKHVSAAVKIVALGLTTAPLLTGCTEGSNHSERRSEPGLDQYSFKRDVVPPRDDSGVIAELADLDLNKYPLEQRDLISKIKQLDLLLKANFNLDKIAQNRQPLLQALNAVLLALRKVEDTSFKDPEDTSRPVLTFKGELASAHRGLDKFRNSLKKADREELTSALVFAGQDLSFIVRSLNKFNQAYAKRLA